MAQGLHPMEPAAGTATPPPGQRARSWLCTAGSRSWAGSRLRLRRFCWVMGEERATRCSAQPLGGHTPSLCRWAVEPLSAHLGQLYPLGNRPDRARLACGPLGPASALGRTSSSCCWAWALPVSAAQAEVTTSTWAAQSTGPSPGALRATCNDWQLVTLKPE